MSGDARVIAFMAAWNRVEQATKFREQFRKFNMQDPLLELPPEYDALMAEADVFARLATVSDPWIGLAAMGYLEEIEADKARASEMRDDLLKSYEEKVEDWHGKAGGSA